MAREVEHEAEPHPREEAKQAPFVVDGPGRPNVTRSRIHFLHVRLDAVEGHDDRCVREGDDQARWHQIAGGNLLVVPQCHKRANAALEEEIGLQEDGPVETLANEKGRVPSKQFLDSVALNAAEKLGVGELIALDLGHEVHFDPLNWAEKGGLEDADAQPCEQFEHFLVFLQAGGQHVFVEIGESDHQGIPVAVFQNAPGQVRDGASVETLEDPLTVVNFSSYREFMPEVRLRLPLSLDRVKRMLDRKPDQRSRQPRHRAHQVKNVAVLAHLVPQTETFTLIRRLLPRRLNLCHYSLSLSLNFVFYFLIQSKLLQL